MKKVFVAVLLTFGLLLAAFFYFRDSYNKIFVSGNSTNRSVVSKTHPPSLSLQDNFDDQRPFNILLLGYGGGKHDGAYLTDTIIVARIDPKQKEVYLISVPRDIWIKLPTSTDGSYWKINAAYYIGLDDRGYPKKSDTFKGDQGPGNLAKYAVETVTGLTMDRFLTLDFSGFENAINSLGGIEIDVDTTFDDYEYPITGKEDDLCGHQVANLPDLEKIASLSAVKAFPCRYEHLHFDKGLARLDGETALKFVRSRHSLQGGGDFGRANRQRKVITAVKDRVLQPAFLPKALPLFDSLKNNIKTDLSLSDTKALFKNLGDLKAYSIKSLALTDQNVLMRYLAEDGEDTLIPKSGLDKWDFIHNWLVSRLDSSGINYSPVIKVKNGTRISGLAQLASNRLKDRDFHVIKSEDIGKDVIDKTTIEAINGNIDLHVLEDLKQEFGVLEVSKSTSLDAQAYDILIIIGKDYNALRGKELIN